MHAMKTIKLALVLSALTLVAADVFGQGTVNFANQSSILSSPPDRLVRFRGADRFGISDGTPFSTNASGHDFSGVHAQLFYGPTANMFSMVAVTTAPASFRNSSSTSVGTWFGGTRTLHGFNAGALVYLQVRAWDITLAPTWDDFLSTTGFVPFGYSAVFSYTVPSSPTPAPAEFIMQNFPGFNVDYYIPEPAASALLGLAALCFGMVRRGRWRK